MKNYFQNYFELSNNHEYLIISNDARNTKTISMNKRITITFLSICTFLFIKKAFELISNKDESYFKLRL